MPAWLSQWSDIRLPVIGVVHLAPLPGAPRFGGDQCEVERSMLRDAAALAEGGVHALLLENYGDVPFFPGRVPHQVITHMTALGLRLRQEYPELPLGINVLRNDGCGALAVGHAIGAHFIRVNVLSGARVTDQGLIEAVAHELLRAQDLWRARGIRICADIDVKHSVSLGAIPLEQQTIDAIHRGQADVVIVSGTGTGQPTEPDRFERIKAVAGQTPVWVGSGVTDENIESWAAVADAAIVGTWLKRDGVTTNPVDQNRVRELVQIVA